jgi:hypothetical protein
LRTSVLDRVNGELAGLLTGRPGSEPILLDLEDANAFVESLDPGRGWFRYHRLLADFLRLELRRTLPAEVPMPHRRAAEWFLEQARWPRPFGTRRRRATRLRTGRGQIGAERLFDDHPRALGQAGLAEHAHHREERGGRYGKVVQEHWSWERHLLVAERTRPTVVAVTVSGGDLILVIRGPG